MTSTTIFDEPGVAHSSPATVVAFTAIDTRTGDVEISVAGDLDMLTAPRLSAGLAALATNLHRPMSRPESLVSLNLSRVTFLDTAGLRALNDAAETFSRTGWEFHLTDPQPATRRLLHIAANRNWLAPHLSVQPAA